MSRKDSTMFRLLFSDYGISFGLLVLRIASAAMIFRHGLQKIMNFDELSASFFDPIGLGPKASLIMIIMVEAGASILLAAGFLTRLAAVTLTIGLAVAAFMANPQFVFAQSELPILYLVIFTSLIFTGAGRYSIDELINRRFFR